MWSMLFQLARSSLLGVIMEEFLQISFAFASAEDTQGFLGLEFVLNVVFLVSDSILYGRFKCRLHSCVLYRLEFNLSLDIMFLCRRQMTRFLCLPGIVFLVSFSWTGKSFLGSLLSLYKSFSSGFLQSKARFPLPYSGIVPHQMAPVSGLFWLHSSHFSFEFILFLAFYLTCYIWHFFHVLEGGPHLDFSHSSTIMVIFLSPNILNVFSVVHDWLPFYQIPGILFSLISY